MALYLKVLDIEWHSTKNWKVKPKYYNNNECPQCPWKLLWKSPAEVASPNITHSSTPFQILCLIIEPTLTDKSKGAQSWQVTLKILKNIILSTDKNSVMIIKSVFWDRFEYFSWTLNCFWANLLGPSAPSENNEQML